MRRTRTADSSSSRSARRETIPRSTRRATVSRSTLRATVSRKSAAPPKTLDASFRTLVERSLAGVYIIQDGVLAYVNPAFSATFGYEPDELIGTDPLRVIHPDDRASVAENIRRRLRGDDEGRRYTFRGLRKDGNTNDMEVLGGRMELEGRPAVIGNILDITDRKRSEQRIQYLNRTHAVLSAINQEIVRQKDPQAMLENACRVAVEKGRFRMAWIGMLDPSGIRLDPVASAGIVDGYLASVHIDVHDRRHAGGPTSRCIATGEHAICNDIAEDPAFAPWRAEALRRGYRSSGGFPLQVDGRTVGAFNLYAAEPHFFDLEEIELLDRLALDIGFALEVERREGERRRVEQALRESEEQLLQVQKLEAVGRLAGGVAHDFNNILAAIMMQSDLASVMPGLSDEVREMFGEIKVASERAASLTRQLLAFSRRQVMQPRVLNLNDEVTSLTKMLRRIIGEDVQLELRLHPSPLVTRADPGMIDQLVMNLAVNARDAMPNGGRLFIGTMETTVGSDPARLHATVAPGQYVTLRVSDTGGGIAPDVLPRIFEPFFTTKDPGKGTGLGLATVFGIVKQHAGSIAVSSQPGEGTTFEILLPSASADLDSAAERAPDLVPAGGTEGILVVEDDTLVRKLTRVVLEEAGYKVFEAQNGVEALRSFERHKDEIRLLLTDIVLPEALSGRDVAARVREQRPGLKIVYTSGFSADLAGRELALQDGQAFIQKPYEANLILATVRRCLDS